MPCTIVSNNIASPESREAVSQAVCDGIGQKPGDWKVIVYQAEDYPGFAIRINGPGDLRWNWTFFGKEQNPDFIRERVAQSLAAQQSLQELPENPDDEKDAFDPRDSDEASE